MHFLARAPLVLSIALLAVVGRCVLPWPPSPTLEGVARMLGEHSHTSVAAQDFVWEPSRGTLADLFLGRRVLFLGSSTPGGPRDLFRATVRVSPEGRPITVVRAVNLTSSPLGDVHPLVARGHHAAFAMNAYNSVQQITLLDLQGERSVADSLLDRMMVQLTNWQESGSKEGLARTDISMAQACQSVQLNLEPRTLVVAPTAAQERFAVDLTSGEVIPSPAADHVGATSLQVPHLSKPPIIWAVDTVRTWTGPEPIAWLEEKAFDVKDRFKRFAYFGFSGQGEESLKAPASSAAPPPVTPPRALGADGNPAEPPWPPPPLTSLWKNPEPEEGKWEPVRHPFLKRVKVAGAKEAAPPYYYTTYVRADPKRPYSKVLLVAIDSRQLQLGMEGGIEDPKPLTGAHGEGRIPRDPSLVNRVVGAFNGAFKTTHGQYGMMVNRRVLLPPRPGGATVLVRSDGRAGFGTWPASEAIPTEVVSYRQNLEPLIEDGKVNPSGRAQWGFQLPGTSMLTHRSALCLTSAGHMIYAWGGEVSAITLGNAMAQAGCIYAVHLDMNPHHTAFSFLDIRDVARKDYDAKILTPEMETLADRFILWSPKDFFYLALRRFEPGPYEGVHLEGDEGTQPPPAWAPACFHTTLNEEGVPVRVMGFAPGRLRFRLRAGTQSGDKDPSEDLPTSLAPSEARQVLAAIGLGNTTKGRPLGLRIGNSTGSTLGGEAVLLVGENQDPQLLAPGSKRVLPAEGDAIELPALKIAGKTSANATVRSGMRKRGALCVGAEGYLWVAQATASLDESLVNALSKLGCETIASLDRGAHDPSVLGRAGTSTPPVDRYEQPVLYVLSQPAPPGAFLWATGATTNAMLK